MSAAHEFIAAIQAAGLTPPESLIPDGKLHRFASNGKRGDDAGWYVFHDDGIPAGASATGGALRPGPGGRTSAAA
jgi:phage/plasmid primase-like uncharacterized protein